MIALAEAALLPLRSSCVDAIVTSPPYGLGMAYDGVRDTYEPGEYEAAAGYWAAEMERVLVPSDRCFVNIPTDLKLRLKSSDPARWAPHMVWHQALARAGLEYRMLIVWDQAAYDAPCAWGSWLSPNAPNVKGRHEAILWFYKPPFARGRPERNDVPVEAFLELTKSIWAMGTQPRNGAHPCPFPAELVRRCLWLSTWPGDVVLDPFAGSGTTLTESARLGRRPVGCDLSPAYCRAIASRGLQDPLFLSAPSEAVEDGFGARKAAL